MKRRIDIIMDKASEKVAEIENNNKENVPSNTDPVNLIITTYADVIQNEQMTEYSVDECDISSFMDTAEISTNTHLIVEEILMNENEGANDCITLLPVPLILDSNNRSNDVEKNDGNSEKINYVPEIFTVSSVQENNIEFVEFRDESAQHVSPPMNQFDSDDSIRDPNFNPSDSRSSIGSTEEISSPNITGIDPPQALREGGLSPITSGCSGRPKKGRKIKYGMDNRTERKRKKFSNQPYITNKNKKVDPKVFTRYKCKCSKKCHNLVPLQTQEAEFNKYVTLGSFTAQTTFIGACVRQYKKKRSYVTTANRQNTNQREFSRCYYLADIRVCREMFIKTLQINPQKVTVSLKKMRSEAVIKDNRGKHGGWNKTNPEDVKFVTHVINKIPKYISHYSRQNCDASFLPLGMTVNTIYDMYKAEFNDKYQEGNPSCLSYAKVKNIFLSQFNLRTKKLKKDTCNKCDIYRIRLKNAIPGDVQQIQEGSNAHQELAQTLRNKMKDDFQCAKDNPYVECITYDLEKTLPLPHIPTNIVFYKRQLWMYNSGIHVASNDKGYCFVWVEGEAGRGAQEVGSCLIKFIQNNLRQDVTELRLWSDSCGGQNRNIKVTLLLKIVLQNHPTLQKISLRYLEPGHTFLPNDTDFSKIETCLKFHERVYTPEEYINIMKHCRKKNPLEVIKMQPDDFFSTKHIEKCIVNRKVDINGEKINWMKTKEILLKKENPLSIFMRHSFDSEFQELDIRKKAKGRPVQLLTEALLEKLWPNGKEISEAKLKDLKSLMAFIPKDCHSFYKGLKVNETIEDDVDGFGGIPDFDVETDEVDN